MHDGVPKSTSDASTDGDNRTHVRRRQLKAAKIVYRNGNCVLDCAITDISEGGARIDLGIVVDLPDRFFLHFADGSRKREAEVVWRKGTALGVRFHVENPLEPRQATGVGAKHAILDRLSLIEKQLADTRRDLMILLRD